MKSNRRGKKALSVYSNLSNRRKANKDAASRRKAEYLASLPKHPVKRFFYRLHPKRFFTYWFSRQGAIMALKVAGVGALLMVLMFGALFAYYRRELDAIRPSELAKRVQSTVTKYYDRNGTLLWEDKGDGNYTLVVESKDISKYMKDATVAIEDKDFFKHGGFSPSGIVRAAVSNSSSSGGTQGGSTLTQQLVKQVFLADEAQNRGISGIPRKIKEVILSVEVERMYNKDQILTLYLNESPYGGRRNGVESAAQSYFGKSARDLTLAESALLAAIPQRPTYFNPYTTDPVALKSLIARKDTTLDYMADQGMVTRTEANEAKKVAVLDTVKPETDQFKDMKAPHFVQMVKADLEKKLGKKFGKSEEGAVWLDKKKTSVYKFYQFWLNVDDEGVFDYMKIYTLLDRLTIEELMARHKDNPGAREAQSILAYEVTKLVHGDDGAERARNVTAALFGNTPFDQLLNEEIDMLAEEIPVSSSGSLITALVTSGICTSNGEARRLIAGNAISVNGQKVADDIDLAVPSLIKKGKNTFVLVR